MGPDLSAAGELNQRGLDFYDRLVDALLAVGIAPLLTIFHLEERRGWPAWEGSPNGHPSTTSLRWGPP